MWTQSEKDWRLAFVFALFSTSRCVALNSQGNGNLLILHQSIKRTPWNQQNTVVRYPCYRLLASLNAVFSDLQHGFLKNRSCLTQLLSALHDTALNLDKNIQTDVIYLDFAKAFDKKNLVWISRFCLLN